jgi:hypothetical protein
MTTQTQTARYLPSTAYAYFPAAPHAWNVVGVYRNPDMAKRSQGTSATVYTASKRRDVAERAAAEGPGRWMRVVRITYAGQTGPAEG